MATRRSVLALAGAVSGAVVLGACRRHPRTPAATAGPPADQAADLLITRSRSGLALVPASDGRHITGPWPGAAAWDASAFAAARHGGGQTRVDVLGADGRPAYTAELAGELTARVVAPRGDLVALTEADAGSDVGETYRPIGRSHTTVVIAGRGGERFRLTVPGCVEPEAFSITGEHLIVLDYRPPENPDRYRVRLLELASGRLRALFTRDKVLIQPGAEEEMRGEGRQAVYAPLRGFLYTLYTHQGEHAHTRDLLTSGARAGAPDVHAFVHSLSLDQFPFAYCVDLPAPFGHGPAQAHAIALSPGSEHPYVVDATSQMVAHIDSSALEIRRTSRLPGIGAQDSTASAAISVDERALFIGAGTMVHRIRTSDLTLAGSWRAPAQVRGLGVSPDGRRLWVGQPSGAIALDPHHGGVLATVHTPELLALEGVTGSG